jgi:transcription elongation factor SPT6
MSLRDLIEGEAIMDDDENDEGVADDYDGEGREGAGTRNHYNDSSEEEDEEEDDEEAARAVRFALDLCSFHCPADQFIGP